MLCRKYLTNTHAGKNSAFIVRTFAIVYYKIKSIIMFFIRSIGLLLEYSNYDGINN